MQTPLAIEGSALVGAIPDFDQGGDQSCTSDMMPPLFWHLTVAACASAAPASGYIRT
jgi:hypothetical protein